ncbi:putative cytochrome bd menaquinol oxidase subunit I [compost metagenome]
MAGIGFALLAISVLYFLFVFWKKRNVLNKWMLGIIALIAPLAFLAVELGWFYAEVGRQPWIIRGYMRVEEAATTSPNVRIIFFALLLLYIVLGSMCVIVLRRLFNNNPAEVEMEKWMKDHPNQSTEKGGTE